MKSHLIMPMGGAGSRFYKNGYMQPKPLIEIHEKPFFYWAAMSILKFIPAADVTFVVLKQHVNEFQIDEIIRTYFPDAQVKVLPELLPGPVYTALEGVHDLQDDAPVIINDCDHMFCCQRFNRLMNGASFPYDGVLLTFESDMPQYSYVRYGGSGEIVGTAEKQVVSSHAICGAYTFRSATLFREAASEYIQNGPAGEKFMSVVYSVLCERGMKLKDHLLDFHVEFGTPAEYETAQASPYFRLFE